MIAYLFFLVMISFSFSQECEDGRYEDEIFDNIYITSGVYYGTNINEGLFGNSNEDLYLEAITHSSYKNIQNQSFDNERLEFLGDAFISLIVAKYLFKLYPKKQEGYLTQLRAKIVSRDHLNKLGSSIGLEEFILYQKSANNYKSLVGNAFEALYGAIFLDLGFERAQISFEKFILIPHLDCSSKNRAVQMESSVFFSQFYKSGG